MLLRAKDWTQVDWEPLIEEIETVGDQYRHALQSHVASSKALLPVRAAYQETGQPLAIYS